MRRLIALALVAAAAPGAAAQEPSVAQTPVIVVEPEPGSAAIPIDELRRLGNAHETTRRIDRFLFYDGLLPVDVRHNIKINREQLAVWATRKLMG